MKFMRAAAKALLPVFPRSWWMGLAALPALALGAPLYRAVDVGLVDGAEITHVYDLGDRGDAVAYSGAVPVSWNATTGLVPIPQPQDDTRLLMIKAINATRATAGTLHGPAGVPTQAVFVSPSRARSFFLRGTWAADSLDPVAPVKDLSNANEVLGVSALPWLWSANAGLRAIGTHGSSEYKVNRLNDRSQVAGYREVETSDDCSGQRAFVYDAPSGRFTPLDDGPPDIEQNVCRRYSQANGINEVGQVVGWAYEDDGGSDPRRPFIWSASTGRRPLVSADRRKVDLVPLDINDRGQVVGTFQYSDHVGALKDRRFFYWDEAGGVVDLQDLLDPGDPMSGEVDLRTDDDNVRINADGVISAAGRLAGSKATRAFILSPR